MDSQELCIYIERFRSAKKISQENLTEGIVSLRQYRRYLNGESDMPFHIFLQMVDNLGLKTETVLREMENVRYEEYQYANKLYNCAVNYDFKGFDLLIKNNIYDHFIDQTNELFYNFSLLIKDYMQKKIDNKFALQKVSELLNYPQILKHEVITEIELLVLSFMTDVAGKVDQKKIVDRIFYFFNNSDQIITGGNNRIIILIIAKFAKIFGIRDNYELVIEFCNIGIKRSQAYKSYYLNEYLYYYLSLAYYKLNNIEMFENSLKKCFNILEFDDNESKMKKFETLINEDYDLEFKKYVIKLYYEEFNK